MQLPIHYKVLPRDLCTFERCKGLSSNPADNNLLRFAKNQENGWHNICIQPSQNVPAAGNFAAYNEMSAAYFTVKFTTVKPISSNLSS